MADWDYLEAQVHQGSEALAVVRPTAWVSVAWANTQTFPARPKCASRRLAHPEVRSKENVNQAHVHCKPLLGDDVPMSAT
jgi:hypothetical protein